jgi:hypothetical protein
VNGFGTSFNFCIKWGYLDDFKISSRLGMSAITLTNQVSYLISWLFNCCTLDGSISRCCWFNRYNLAAKKKRSAWIKLETEISDSELPHQGSKFSTLYSVEVSLHRELNGHLLQPAKLVTLLGVTDCDQGRKEVIKL